MKYIRTKDGIIIDTSKFPIKREIYENGKLKVYEFWTSRYIEDREVKILFVNEIAKPADNIEYLLDEYVIIPIDQNKKPITQFIRHINEPISPFINDSHIIYGAIWIKGEYAEPILKSVVEMKGVLPNGEIDWELL